MAIASLRSILALKPPFTHSSAAPLPANSPRRMSDLPTIAAVIAPIPIMKGVAMPKLLDQGHSARYRDHMISGESNPQARQFLVKILQ